MAYSSFMTNQPSKIYIEALTDAEASVWHHSYIHPLMTTNIKWFYFSRKVDTGIYIRKKGNIINKRFIYP